ncbi:MAG: hypothetical protein IK012_04135 [Fibrobacter sp.]|uniref:hypothetical protein n=1 Tax=Fibrobacter sp. TaxID=35828 RepID=UPI0025BFFD2C|nr:hypothetical protein [Fibrobacter sp.]MBR4784428.1 hypothetical protein [Fibrobacter sp.]
MACNSEKKEFLTPKQGEVVLDVMTDNYSLNGKIIGKTSTDISAIDDVIDKPLYKEICALRAKAQEEGLKNNLPADDFFSAKLHVDEKLSYGDFYKSLASMRSCGYAGYKLAIGSNYKDVFRLNYPICTNPMLNSCASFISEMKSLRLKKLSNHQKLLLEEMLDKDVEERKKQIECVKDYTPLDLVLYYYHENDGCAYLVSLNETKLNNDSLFQGYNYYTFYNETELWKFIENLRSKMKPQINDRRNKRPALFDGRNEIDFVLKKEMLMKDIAPIIKKLTSYGYKISFAQIGG